MMSAWLLKKPKPSDNSRNPGDLIANEDDDQCSGSLSDAHPNDNRSEKSKIILFRQFSSWF